MREKEKGEWERIREVQVLIIELHEQCGQCHQIVHQQINASFRPYLAKDPKLPSVVDSAQMFSFQIRQRMEPSFFFVTLMFMVEDINRSGAWTVSDRDIEPTRAVRTKEKEGCVLTATAVVTFVLVLFGVLVECVVVWIDGRGNEGQV